MQLYTHVYGKCFRFNPGTTAIGDNYSSKLSGVGVGFCVDAWLSQDRCEPPSAQLWTRTECGSLSTVHPLLSRTQCCGLVEKLTKR